MENILSTSQITKTYGKYNAVNNLSINVKQGDIYGIIGKNGAGKTTLLKMISNLSFPTSGSYEIFEKNPNKVPAVLKKVGILIEEPGLFMDMTAYQNLKTKCILLGIKNDDHIKDLLSLVGLGNVGKKKVKDFSLGMKQRLGIALAMVGNPELLLLDEPINGLDPEGIVHIREVLLKLNKEKNVTIIISSHILEELSKICTKYAFINKGILVEEITADELFEKCKSIIVLRTESSEKSSVILNSLGVTDYKIVDDKTIHILKDFERCGEIATAIAKNDISILEVYQKHTPLENYFLNITGGKIQ